MILSKKGYLKFFLIPLSLLTILFCTAISLATNNDFSEDIIEDSCSENYLKKIVKSVSINSSTEFSIPELNKILSDIGKKDLYVTNITQDQGLSFYMPVEYSNIKTAFTFNLLMTLDNDCFKINVFNTKVGKLPIPKKIILNLLKDSFPEPFELSNDQIICPANVSFDFYKMKVNVTVTHLSFYDGSLSFKTSGNICF